MSTATSRDRSANRVRSGLVAIAAAAVLAAALAPAASAESATESPLGPSMNLTFNRAKAKTVGNGALVSVRCQGPAGGTCVGTVTLFTGTGPHKVPFSVIGGHEQSLFVPTGDLAEQRSPGRVRAVAKTVQPLGACRETERLLRLR